MNRWKVVSLVLTVLALTTVLVVFFGMGERLPEQVPVHWNIDFKADAFVARDEVLPYLLLYPGVMGLMVMLNFVLPWLSPKNFKIEPFQRVFDYVMALIVMLFGYLLTVHLLLIMTDGPWLQRLFVGGIFLFFAFLGMVIGQVRRNFWMGVRTPWTLASEVVWNETHRHAGWLWSVAGFVGFVAVLAGVPMGICFGGLMGVVLWPMVYSLVLYKRLERQDKV